MSSEIHFLISNKQWDRLVERYRPNEIAQKLSFKEAMFFARDLFFETEEDFPTIRNYAINLFFAIRRQNTPEWDKDWKNDVFLSGVCQLGYKYKESYDCCMRAYKKFDDPPPLLLLELAGCFSLPFFPRRTLDQAEPLLQRALQKGGATYELAQMFKGIYIKRNDSIQVEYWSTIAEEAKRDNKRTGPCIPDVFAASNSAPKNN